MDSEGRGGVVKVMYLWMLETETTAASHWETVEAEGATCLVLMQADARSWERV